MSTGKGNSHEFSTEIRNDTVQILKRIPIPARDEMHDGDMEFLRKCDMAELSLNGRWRSSSYVNRIGRVLDCVRRGSLPGDRVLDVGAAQCNHSVALSLLGYRVTALEIRPSFIEYAVQKIQMLPEAEIDLVRGDMAGSPFRTDSYDIVMLLEVLEHTSSPKSLLSEAGRILKSDGLLLLSTVNQRRLTSFAEPYSAFSQNREDPPYDNTAAGHEHLYEFTPQECVQLAIECGLVPIGFQMFNSILSLPLLTPFPLGNTSLFANVEKRILNLPRIGELLAMNMLLVLRKTR